MRKSRYRKYKGGPENELGQVILLKEMLLRASLNRINRSSWLLYCSSRPGKSFLLNCLSAFVSLLENHQNCQSEPPLYAICAIPPDPLRHLYRRIYHRGSLPIPPLNPRCSVCFDKGHPLSVILRVLLRVLLRGLLRGLLRVPPQALLHGPHSNYPP